MYILIIINRHVTSPELVRPDFTSALTMTKFNQLSLRIMIYHDAAIYPEYSHFMDRHVISFLAMTKSAKSHCKA